MQATDVNSRSDLLQRRAAGTLTWRDPALMLLARAALAQVAQGVVAVIFLLRASPTPWQDSESWLPAALHGWRDSADPAAERLGRSLHLRRAHSSTQE